MNSENSIRENDKDISDPNASTGEAVLYLVLFIAPIVYKAVGQLANFAHDAMEHGYDIKVKAGPVDFALTKK